MMNTNTSSHIRRVLVMIFCIAAITRAGTVVLKTSFVVMYKDRATIEADFYVDHAHPRPNPPAKDGDMHVAGRSPDEVGLPMVAEVMNAAQSSEQDAVKRIHSVEGTGKAVHIVGAWRLWFEHPAQKQIQFASVPVADNTNPDHSFEIHPITNFDADDISISFQAIRGFTPYDAKTAFPYYESLTATVSSTDSAITIESKKSQYNYAEFYIQLKGKPLKLDDGGYAVLADVFDKDSEKDDDAVATGVRMIFVPGTPPLQKLTHDGLGQGDELHVIGIPRVNLNAIYSFVQANHGRCATRKLPYEMIIVAVVGK